ncbi:hypothetical protein I316_07359 [Kwoniella heveanensis BCC8398]|uniref:HhH-GPD domain-containing protein n=1 Tax=Kwoniella heveanensis BCC8398 TaxID=1296120 RepID=A0A1B9GIW7_9TREE|nr:hypothetical protein I316_07359 [Kwoniella heveanensis BCC8398]
MATRRSTRIVSRKHSLSPAPLPSPRKTPKRTPTRTTVVKVESPDDEPLVKIEDPSANRSSDNTDASPLKDRKLKLLSANLTSSPFPTFGHPTPAECVLAHDILTSIHGRKTRPSQVVASKTRAGCGDSPSVLDALVRTILSQNTSDANSTRAKLSMDAVYGGSDNWEDIVEGGQERLQEAIKCGGLSQVKSKVILKILNQAKERYGVYSLDHLHSASTDEAMQELLSFDGVGPKTASCVLLFCLQREDFAVDTHVHRITGLLGWRPKNASRDQTYHHLNKKIPDELKYALHVLFVSHGKVCEDCKAGAKGITNCQLRKAFRSAVIKDVKPERIVAKGTMPMKTEERSANAMSEATVEEAKAEIVDGVKDEIKEE